MRCSYLKPLMILAFSCLPFISIWGQSCLSGGIVFSRQSQIDSFPLNYPGCTTITGTVLIKEAISGNITRLDSLIQIKQVSRAFTISDNTNLVNLKGLNNLESVNSNFAIGDNKELSGLDDLNNLKSVTRDFGIAGSPKLLSLNGLKRLKKVGSLLISNLPVQSLEGLDSLETISNQLTIANCNDLVTLDGIETLILEAEELWLYNNQKITDLKNLPVIKRLKRLHISYNQNLLSLDGLDSLTLADQIDLEINPKLTSLLGFKSLTSVPVQFYIKGNTELVTLAGLDSLKQCGRLLIDDNTKLLSIEALKGLSRANFFRVMNNFELQTLAGLDNVDPGTLTEFEIVNNYSLSTCHVKSICGFFTLYPLAENPNIQNNFEDCNSANEIKAKCASILPAKMGKLEAQQEGGRIKLTWVTLTETNNLGFWVQRSVNATQWQTIGFVNGSVNSNQQHNYVFSDAKPSAGMVYYRLKQVDLDGKFSLSNVVNLKISGSGMFSILPNPATHFVEINGLEKAEVKVMDVDGRIMSRLLVSGRTHINLSGLKTGLYYFEITSGNAKTVRKVIKQ